MDESRLTPQEAIARALERIYRQRMTTTSGGNLSIRDEAGNIWITPARVDKGSLGPTDIIRVRRDGTMEGPHPPSSELAFHRAIYEVRPDLKGIVHAHPTALVAFSMTGQVPDTSILRHAHRICGKVAFAPYALPGSARLADKIARTALLGGHCFILENHGVVVGGESLEMAYRSFETLELTARTILRAKALGTVRRLSDRELSRSPAGLSTYPAPAPSERGRRELLAAFLRRGCRQQLFSATAGSFSVRLEDGGFLTTPDGVNRHSIEPEDFMAVRGSGGDSVSRFAGLHAEIFSRHPEIGAVVNAYPINATAFSVTGSALNARTIPESFLLLRDIHHLAGPVDEGGEAHASVLSMARPIAVFEGDGVLACGRDVLDAFDRMEVLEATAEAWIHSRLIGEITPMGDAVIAELTEAFAGML